MNKTGRFFGFRGRACAIFIALALLFGTLFSFTSCENKRPTFRATFYNSFNTVSIIECYSKDTKDRFTKTAELIESELLRYHKYYDIYYEYSGINNLRTVNLMAGREPVKVDSEIIDLLLFSKELYYMTSGEINIAMGSVLSLWHAAREAKEHYLPSEAELLGAAEHTDIEKVIIDREASTVYLADPLMSLDVGAVAKGYATERVREKLVSLGMGDGYVLNIGGNLRMIGTRSGGTPWDVNIINPDTASSEKYVSKISVFDTSVVTSGDYERYMTVNGVRYHHIIDKDTLYPSTHFASVSIVTDDGGLADGLSTALFSMTYEDGLLLINSLAGVEALWVRPNGEVLMSDGYADFVKK